MLTDSVFSALIPPLSPSEFARLENNILAYGIRDPLVMWRGVLIDGRHRLAICKKHGLEYQTLDLTEKLPTRAAVIEWMVSTQLGRRNLTAYAAAELTLQAKEEIAALAKRTQGRAGAGGVSTRKQLATIATTSEDTIRKVEIASGILPPNLAGAARSGLITVNAAYNAANALVDAPSAVRAFCNAHAITEVWKIKELTRLSGTDTGAAILASGGYDAGGVFYAFDNGLTENQHKTNMATISHDHAVIKAQSSPGLGGVMFLEYGGVLPRGAGVLFLQCKPLDLAAALKDIAGAGYTLRAQFITPATPTDTPYQNRIHDNLLMATKGGYRLPVKIASITVMPAIDLIKKLYPKNQFRPIYKKDLTKQL